MGKTTPRQKLTDQEKADAVYYGMLRPITWTTRKSILGILWVDTSVDGLTVYHVVPTPSNDYRDLDGVAPYRLRKYDNGQRFAFEEIFNSVDEAKLRAQQHEQAAAAGDPTG